MQFGTQLYVSGRYFKTPPLLTGVVFATTNSQDIYSPVDSAVWPPVYSRHLSQVFLNHRLFQTNVHSFFQEWWYPPIHYSYIFPASGAAKLSPELYLVCCLFLSSSPNSVRDKTNGDRLVQLLNFNSADVNYQHYATLAVFVRFSRRNIPACWQAFRNL